MGLITNFLTAGLLIWFVLLAVIIVGRVLRGDMPTTGILCTRLQTKRGEAKVAPERAISMMTIPVVIIGYAFSALHTDVSAIHSLPELSNDLLMLLTGGNGLYLAGKIARTQ